MARAKLQSSLIDRPTVTLLSDFGTRDAYVALMKAAVLRDCPSARVLDVTHEVPPQDVQCGSITLERAVDGFWPGSVHLAVVDPGVGTDRRLLVVEIARQWVVCPDNGLITWAWRCHSGATAHELTWRPAKYTSVFHGRDILAPAAAKLASGEPVHSIAKPIDDPVLLEIAPAKSQAMDGSVIHLDRFGNATTNIRYQLLRAINVNAIRIKSRSVGKLRRTYYDVAPGKPLALIGSSGLLEIAVRDGSAAERLKIRVGDRVTLR